MGHHGIIHTLADVADSGPPLGACERSADVTSGQDNAHVAPTFPLALGSDPGTTTINTHIDTHTNKSDTGHCIVLFKTPSLSFGDPSPTGSNGLLLKPEANPTHASSRGTGMKRRAEREREIRISYQWRGR